MGCEPIRERTVDVRGRAAGALLTQSKSGRSGLVYKKQGDDDIPALKNIFIKKIVFQKPENIFFAKRDSAYVANNEFSGLLKAQFVLTGANFTRTAFKKINDSGFIFISIYKEWIYGVLVAENLSEGEKIQNYLYNLINAYNAGEK